MPTRITRIAIPKVVLHSYFCDRDRYKFRANTNICPLCRMPAEPYSKFKNKPTVVDGVWYASKAEAEYDGTLKLLEREGKIRDVYRQVSFELEVPDQNGRMMKICDYVADWTYWEGETFCVVDRKGMKSTRLFKIKKKLMKACHGIDVIEVRVERVRRRRKNEMPFTFSEDA